LDYWLNPLAGALVGMMVGATGVGGGAIMTPLLVLMLGVTPHTAVGTDLLYASITKMFGVGIHGAQGRVDWQVVRRLATGSLPAAISTLIWLRLEKSDGFSQGAIIVGLGIVLIVTALAMTFQPYLGQVGKYLRTSDPTHFKKYQPVLTVMAGAAIGFLVALTSIGAGALGAVILLFLYPLRLTPAGLVATDLAHAIPLALIAGLGHLLLGNVDFILLGQLLLGSIPGVWIGAHLSGKLPDQVLRIGIALTLGGVGTKLLS